MVCLNLAQSLASSTSLCTLLGYFVLMIFYTLTVFHVSRISFIIQFDPIITLMLRRGKSRCNLHIFYLKNLKSGWGKSLAQGDEARNEHS